VSSNATRAIVMEAKMKASAALKEFNDLLAEAAAKK
jgi:hypothetical protein